MNPKGRIGDEAYPLSMACNKTSKMAGGDVPCPGIAVRFKQPVMVTSNDKGPWYGCPLCRCVAQYEDFVLHAKVVEEQKAARLAC